MMTWKITNFFKIYGEYVALFIEQKITFHTHENQPFTNGHIFE
jgi:hypothetical protein